MTPTAKYADILLPVNTQFERNDIIRPWQGGPYCIYMNKAIDSLYESKSDLEICTGLAEKLGLSEYNELTEDEWLRDFWEAAKDLTDSKPLPDYDSFKKEGIFKVKTDKPIIAFAKQIKDPENNPFPTPSGKIEIYSEKLEERNTPNLPPIPMYIETWEGRNDPLAKKYPLQLISTHSKRRIHSNMDNLPWMKNLETHVVWINPEDAETRGLKNNDNARVFNDRGTISIKVKVTERIIPGTVSVGQGAWYSPDKEGVDRGGCANVLLKDDHSPAGAFCSNTCLVEINKEEN
jgi:anaerobic dimethyl sulfoxide reductase subunit A